MKRLSSLIIAGLIWLPAIAAEVQTALPAFQLEDQHGKTHTFDPGTRRIYANADRKGDKLMKSAMEKLDQTVLDAQKSIVVADISEAPFFVKSIIRSSLKDRLYLTLLDKTGSTRGLLPYRADHVSVVDLDRGRIRSVRHIATVEALKLELTPTRIPAQD